MSQNAVKKLASAYVRSAAEDNNEIGSETFGQRRPSMCLRPHRQYIPVIGLSKRKLTPVPVASDGHSWISKKPGKNHWLSCTDGANLDESKVAPKEQSPEQVECTNMPPAIAESHLIESGGVAKELGVISDKDQESGFESVAVPYRSPSGQCTNESQRSKGHRKGNRQGKNQPTEMPTAQNIDQQQHVLIATDKAEELSGKNIHVPEKSSLLPNVGAFKFVDCFVLADVAPHDCVPQHIHIGTRSKSHGTSLKHRKTRKAVTGSKPFVKGMPFYSRTSHTGKNLSSSSRGLWRAPMLLRPNRKYTSVFPKRCACERSARRPTEVSDTGKHTQCNRKGSQVRDAFMHELTNPDIQPGKQTQAISDTSSVSLPSAIGLKCKGQSAPVAIEQLSPSKGESSAFIQAPKSPSRKHVHAKTKEGINRPPKPRSDAEDSRNRYSERENALKRKKSGKSAGKVLSGDWSVLKEINDASSHQFISSNSVQEIVASSAHRKIPNTPGPRWSKAVGVLASKRVMMLRPYTRNRSLAGMPKSHTNNCKHWLLSQGDSHTCPEKDSPKKMLTTTKLEGQLDVIAETEESHSHDTAASSPSDCPESCTNDDKQCLLMQGSQEEVLVEDQEGQQELFLEEGDKKETALPSYAVINYAPKVLMMLRPYPPYRPVSGKMYNHSTGHFLLVAQSQQFNTNDQKDANEVERSISGHPLKEDAAKETEVHLTTRDNVDPNLSPGYDDPPQQATQTQEVIALDDQLSQAGLAKTESSCISVSEEASQPVVNKRPKKHTQELSGSRSKKAAGYKCKGANLHRTLPVKAVKKIATKSRELRKRKRLSNRPPSEPIQSEDLTKHVDANSNQSVPYVQDNPLSPTYNPRVVITRCHGVCEYAPKLKMLPPNTNYQSISGEFRSSQNKTRHSLSAQIHGSDTDREKTSLEEEPNKGETNPNLSYSNCHDRDPLPHAVPAKQSKKSTSFKPMQRQRRRCRSIFAREDSNHNLGKTSQETGPPLRPKKSGGASVGNVESHTCPEKDSPKKMPTTAKLEGQLDLIAETEESHSHDTAASSPSDCPESCTNDDKQCLLMQGSQEEVLVEDQEGQQELFLEEGDKKETALPSYAVITYAPKVLMMLRPYPPYRPVSGKMYNHSSGHFLLLAQSQQFSTNDQEDAHEVERSISCHPLKEDAAKETEVHLTSRDSIDPNLSPGYDDPPQQATQTQEVIALDDQLSQAGLAKTESTCISVSEEASQPVVNKRPKKHTQELSGTRSKKAAGYTCKGTNLHRTLPVKAVKKIATKSREPRKRKRLSNRPPSEPIQSGDLTKHVDANSNQSVLYVQDNPSYSDCNDGDPLPHSVQAKQSKKSTSFQPMQRQPMQRQRRRCRSIFARVLSNHHLDKPGPPLCLKKPGDVSVGNVDKQSSATPLQLPSSNESPTVCGDKQEMLAKQNRLHRACLDIHLLNEVPLEGSVVGESKLEVADVTAKESSNKSVDGTDSDVSRSSLQSSEEGNNHRNMPTEESSVTEDSASCLTVHMLESENSVETVHEEYSATQDNPQSHTFTAIENGRNGKSDPADSSRDGPVHLISPEMDKDEPVLGGCNITKSRPIKPRRRTAMNLRKTDKHFLFSLLGFKKAKQQALHFVRNTKPGSEPNLSKGRNRPKKRQASLLEQGIKQRGFKNRHGRGARGIAQPMEDAKLMNARRTPRLRKPKDSAQHVDELSKAAVQEHSLTLGSDVIVPRRRGRPVKCKLNVKELPLKLASNSHQQSKNRCTRNERNAQQKNLRKGSKAVLQELALTVGSDVIPRRRGRPMKRKLNSKELPLQRLASNSYQELKNRCTRNKCDSQQRSLRNGNKAVLQELSQTLGSDGIPRRSGRPKKRKWNAKELASNSHQQSKNRCTGNEHDSQQRSLKKGNQAVLQELSRTVGSDVTVPQRKGRPRKRHKRGNRKPPKARQCGSPAPARTASSSLPQLPLSKRIRQLIPGYTSPDEEEFTLEEFCSLSTLEEAVDRAARENRSAEVQQPSHQKADQGQKTKCTESESLVVPSSSNKKRRAKRSSRSPEGSYWDCSVCTYRNKAEAFKCAMCDVRKGTSTRKPRLNAQLVAQQQAQQNLSPLIHVKPVKTTTPRGPAQRKAGTSKKPRPRLKNVDRSTAISTEVIVNNVPVIITEFKEKSHTRTVVDSDEASADRPNGNVNGL